MPEAAAPGKASAILNLLALGNFTVGMGAFVVIGIITPLADGLGVPGSKAGIVLTAYAIAYALLSPLGAAVTGRFPRRAVLAAALALFCVGSAASALSWNLYVLTASRVFVALGAALFTPLAAGVAVALVAPEQRGRALARVFGGITLAQVLGVPFGAWLAYRFGWSAPFWTAALLAAATMLVLLRALPAHVEAQATSMKALGTALSSVSLMLAVSFTATIMAAIYIIFTYFGPLIEASVGTNPETRSAYLLLFGLGAVAGNFVGGHLSDRIGPRKTLLLVCIAQILMMPLFSIVPWGPVPFAVIVAVWSVIGWSFMAPQQSRLVAIASDSQSLALALNAAMIYVGIAIGSAVGSVLLDGYGLQALGVAGGCAAVLALLHLLLSSRAGGALRPTGPASDRR